MSEQWLPPWAERPTVPDYRRDGYFKIQDIIIDRYGAVLKPYGLAVYMALARRANKECRCWPSYETIAADTGMSPRQAMREAKKLAELGLIQIIKRRNDPNDMDSPANKSNVFMLLEPGEG